MDSPKQRAAAPNEVPTRTETLIRLEAEAGGISVKERRDQRLREDVAAHQIAARAWAHHKQPEQEDAARRNLARSRVALARWRHTMAARRAPGAPRAPRTAPRPRAHRPRGRSTRQRGPDDDGGEPEPAQQLERRPPTSRQRAVRELRDEQERLERLAERRERAGDLAGRSRAAELAWVARRTADALEGLQPFGEVAR